MNFISFEKIVQPSPDLALTLRLARLSDVPELDRVMKACAHWLEQEGYTHWDVYKDGSHSEEDVSAGKVYCAFDKSRSLIATFTIAHDSPPYAEGSFDAHWEDSKSQARFFKKPAVDPGYHSHGIGKALLNEAEDISRKAGAHYLRLDINPGIPWLGDYYQKLGFVYRARLPAGIIYEKSL